jgi:ketosteroid isomerase-like protein
MFLDYQSMKHFQVSCSPVAVFTTCLVLAYSQQVFSQVPNPEWQVKVKGEVSQVLDNYREAMLNRDYDEMISFWSNSVDFVMGSEGRIIGGYEEWIAGTTRHYENTQKFEQWDWRNIHILPLSDAAATVTLELEFKSILLTGEIYHAIGSWTYVFREEGESWKVVHSNGHHIKL